VKLVTAYIKKRAKITNNLMLYLQGTRKRSKSKHNRSKEITMARANETDIPKIRGKKSRVF
jgi:hypothetical protein